ncbi:hypothetical protein KFL_008090040 [Klebsormidium nitens]|uniref:Uncharacterized protein n=1 Tax=Klebsormidium nitens TaxID=105231 RepID=A0A1Y1ILQ7_KLENI|nr:hypothetical protein KFL_008090040 [Klebsormidium nitens]|eukprot:GAQ91573.1 hypothetical protein KFL_008090040 [Klebsormidium nitens]
MDLSPPADGGPYSHWVKGRRQRNRVTLPFLNATIPSKGHLAPSDFRPTEGGGKRFLEELKLGGKLGFLSAGSHGRAYRAKQAPAAFHNQLFRCLSAYVIGNPKMAPSSVVIKVHLLDDYDDIDECQRECKLQSWLHNQETTFRGSKVCGSDVVPPIFYAGLLEGHDRMGMAFITVMGEAPGQPIDKFREATMGHELDILKAFVVNGESYEVDIIWEGTRPLFKANDIGVILRGPHFVGGTVSFF